MYRIANTYYCFQSSTYGVHFKILMEWLSILHTTAKWLNCSIKSLFILLLHFCSTQFKSFPYLYNEDQFIAALAKDVKIVKTLPKDLKGARRKKEIPSFKVPHGASPYFYLHHVLPMLTKHSVVELLVHSGGCLQVTSITFISNKYALGYYILFKIIILHYNGLLH